MIPARSRLQNMAARLGIYYIILFLCPAAITSFVHRKPTTTRSIHFNAATTATPPQDEDQSLVSTAPSIIPEDDMDIVAMMNMKMHQDAVKKSESTFYGFYPDGFAEFNVDLSPSNWICYSLDEVDNTLPSSAVAPNAVNIWDTFLQLDKRIIPPPFKSSDLAKTSQTPILSPEECSNMISECENHYYGWGGSNERYGTPSNRVGYMLPLENLSYSYTFVNFELLPRLFPSISLAFSDSLTINPENLRLGGCRVVKYDAADGHVELGMHRDGLLVTANIALNNLDEYEGGGTIIEGLMEPIRLPMGNVLLHPGDVKHGGNAITSGVRYALVCFIFDTTIVPHEKYCQDRMKEDVDAAMMIPIDDATRIEERVRLLNSATKHCADAYKFGKLACNSDSRDDGYDEIVKSFGSRYQNTL